VLLLQSTRLVAAVAELESLGGPCQSLRTLVMGKMKTYASFNDYLKDQNPKNRAIIGALRRFVKRVEPKLKESVKWGNGCWIGSNGASGLRLLCNGICAVWFF
jgi:hypothetical protein